MSELRIWYAIPSASQERCVNAFEKWKGMGYKTAVFLDPGAAGVPADFTMRATEYHPYFGYYEAVNRLTAALADEADIIVSGGDDMFPDPDKNAQQLGQEFVEHFKGTLGVMQPTGDNLHANVHTICGSPWMGVDYIRRGYKGVGPMPPYYKHFYGDEEMMDVCNRLGIMWIRPDVVQYHEHWSRPGVVQLAYQTRNNQYWDVDQKLFFTRRRQGYPDHELAEAA